MLLALFVFAFLSFGINNITEDDYYNSSRLPVIIDVPYHEPMEIEKPKIRPGMKIQEYNESIKNPLYDKVEKDFRIIELILNPGDYYKSIRNENGYVFEEYEFNPNEVIKRIQSGNNNVFDSLSERIEKPSLDIENLRAGLSGDEMPQWWIDKYIKQYLSLTNLNETSVGISLLSDPYKDLDEDNLGNREEMLCGSNPLKRDAIVFKPSSLEFSYYANSVLTGNFSVINLEDTNCYCKILLVYHDRDYRYMPRLESENIENYKTNQFGHFILNVPPKGKINFRMLFNSKYLPNTLYPTYQVGLITNEHYCAYLIPFISDNYSRKPEPPYIIHPKEGSRLTTLSNMKFEWKSPEIEKRNSLIKKYKYQKNVTHVLAKLQFVRVKDNHSFFLTANNTKLNIEDQNFIQRDNFNLQPGNYLWRIIEQTALTDPTNSLWSWFAVGKKIYKPKEQQIKGTSVTGNNAHFSKNNNFVYYIHDLTRGVAMDKSNNHLYYLSNAYYAFSLPKGIDLFRKKRRNFYSYRLDGTPKETGIFTNLWIGWQSGIVVTQKHFFVIHEDKNKVLSQSFFHINKKAIIHDLSVNVPFNFSEKIFYDEFYKREGLEFEKNAEAKFSLPLPKGLTEKRMDDGDIMLSGIPLVDGTFTNNFTLQNGKLVAEIKHIFRIKDVHEPPPFKKRKCIFDKYYWQRINDYNVHYCYVGLMIDYNLPHDVFDYKKENYLKEFQYELLNELPKGLKLDFCDPYPADTTLPPLISICGILQDVGVYTNTIRYTINGQTFERKHIFKVHEKPLESEEYDID